MRHTALAVLIPLILATPAPAMVGGAPPADASAARPVVMIVGSRGSLCTGTAIARDLILTAAHCVQAGAEHKLIEFDAARQPVFRDVARIVRHPQFSLQTMLAHRATADVALIKLAQPLPHGAVARIGSLQERVAVGDRFSIIGYGVTVRGDGTTSGTARSVTLAATGKPGNLQLRLVDPATAGTRAGLGACTGDSGAPAFDARDGAMIGVVSWSTGPNGSGGCGGLTGVTPLSLYRTWIVETARMLGSPLP